MTRFTLLTVALARSIISSRKIQPRLLNLAFILTLCAVAGFSTVASAEKDKSGSGYSHHNNKGNSGHNGKNNKKHLEENKTRGNSSVIIINDNDRQSIQRYVKTNYRPHCPPGLAKKNNGCLPPGQASRYKIGQKLPSDIPYVVVPYAISRHWKLPQSGYQYVGVDNDVLLMSKSDRTIVDAVRLLSDLAP